MLLLSGLGDGEHHCDGAIHLRIRCELRPEVPETKPIAELDHRHLVENEIVRVQREEKRPSSRWKTIQLHEQNRGLASAESDVNLCHEIL